MNIINISDAIRLIRHASLDVELVPDIEVGILLDWITKVGEIKCDKRMFEMRKLWLE